MSEMTDILLFIIAILNVVIIYVLLTSRETVYTMPPKSDKQWWQEGRDPYEDEE